jgi:tetratricopeptide (TPR) repeat protein
MDTTALPSVDEDARRRFEAAWRAGRPEPIERFLPPPDHARFLATLEELIHIELELQWKRGSEDTALDGGRTLPRVEHYLDRFPCLHEPDVLLRLLRQEFAVRQRHGDRPNAGEYRARFPQVIATGEEMQTLTATDGAAACALPSIPGYEILAEIGHGGMGVVYQARQLKLNRLVALKMILRQTHASAEELARFRIEAEAIALLEHPNIVRIYDVGDHEGRPFCALEYVNGGSLAQYQDGTPQPARAAATVVETLARAMHWAHQRGIVHRDLKPGNILLVSGDSSSTIHHPPLPTQQAKITDFGLAKRLEGDSGQTRSGAILGTPSYMAPEQAGPGKAPIGPATDVYGLGAILYELLTGRPPFKAETVFDTMQQVLSEEPVPPRRLQSKVPRDLETICLQCLHKEPVRRYRSAEVLADDLGRFLRGEPIVARPVGRMEQAVKWARRRPAAAGLLVTVILLVVGAVAGLFLWQNQEQRRLEEEFQHQEAQRKEAQSQAERVAFRRSAAESDRSVAHQAIQGDRFDAAARVLRRAAGRLALEPQLADVQADLEKMRDRAQRLADFYRLSDRTQWLGFREDDNEAVAACWAALKAVGVPDQRADWPAHLPAADLQPGQRTKLRHDVNAAILLWASLRVRQGLVVKFKAGKNQDELAWAKTCFASALEMLPLVDDVNSWQIGRLLRSICCHHLQIKEEAPPSSQDGPLNGFDNYGMGMAHLWISAMGTQDPLVAALLKSYLGGAINLDLKKPRETADRMLHRAVELEPDHYWAHFWLGWSYLAARPPQYQAAEMAFSKCIEIRPALGFGYAERGHARILLRSQATDADLRKELERRAQEDLDHALRCDATDPYFHWKYAEVLYQIGQRPRILQELALAAELEAPVRALDGRRSERNTSTADMVKAALERWTAQEPDDLEAWSILARASWVVHQEDAALAAAQKVLAKDGKNVRALGVRGAVVLNRGKTEDALTDFEAALAGEPGDYLALIGRARAQELLGRLFLAEKNLGLVLGRPGRPDWQYVDAHLGAARVLAALGRPDEARASLARADQISPGVTEAKGRLPLSSQQR